MKERKKLVLLKPICNAAIQNIIIRDSYGSHRRTSADKAFVFHFSESELIVFCLEYIRALAYSASE